MLDEHMLRRLSDAVVNLGSLCVYRHMFRLLEEDESASIDDAMEATDYLGLDEEAEIGIYAILTVVEGDDLFEENNQRDRIYVKIARIVKNAQCKSWEYVVKQIGNKPILELEKLTDDERDRMDNGEALEAGVIQVMKILKNYSAYMDKLTSKN